MRKNPQAQRDLHIAGEALAVAVIAPITAYIAFSNPQLPSWQRNFLYVVAAGTLIADGYLLGKWLEQS